MFAREKESSHGASDHNCRDRPSCGETIGTDRVVVGNAQPAVSIDKWRCIWSRLWAGGA